MQTIKPLNECMYCGDMEDLTDEHIIPYALWGDIILPKSSCKSCAEITSKIERKVLKGFMQDTRNVANAPSRRKNKRPKSVERILLNQDGTSIQKTFYIDETYSILTVPEFSKATIFGGESITQGINVIGHQQLAFGVNMLEFLDNNNAQGIQESTSIDVVSFARLLAKIAYGMAVLHNGIFPREECPILPIILNKSNDVGFWIGSSNILKYKSESKHLVATKNQKYNFDNVHTRSSIQLFNGSGLTAFEVAVRVPNWKNIYGKSISLIDTNNREENEFYFQSKHTESYSTLQTDGKITVRPSERAPIL